jgi:CPA1 family monovalent cation:H+ antiporter
MSFSGIRVANADYCGNYGFKYGMTDITVECVNKFWELIDEIMNAILFVLIGLELVIIPIHSTILLLALLLIVVWI